MEVQRSITESSVDSDSTSVRVAVRIRPQSAKEKAGMNHICTTVAPNEPQIIIGKDATFTYDHVFNMNSCQDHIFQTLAKPLIDGCMDGYNATIIAYGQTGSGKTYTMGTGFDFSCNHTDAGIVPRAVQYLFTSVARRRAEAAAKQQPVPEFKVVAQFLELYNEELVDLLDSEKIRKSHLRLHENAQGDIYLTGVSTRLVSSLDDTLKCLRDGSLIRSTASTNMNTQSSRSHAIFTLHIRQQRLLKYEEDSSGQKKDILSDADVDPDSTVTDQVPEYETLTAKFHFVDLAGSERLKRTGATGDRAKEGISINRGLLALGNVISALGDKAKRGCHVPYRDSKLTRLLQDSLGGNSRTIMIACISPSDCDFLETLNTLKYANRARNIRNRVTMNQDKTSKQLATLRAQLAALEDELNEYRQGRRLAVNNNSENPSDLSREIDMLQSENDKLHLRVKALAVTVDALKVRNAQLLADQETCSWATLKFKLFGATHDDDESNEQIRKQEPGDRLSSVGIISADAEDFRHLVEKYTIEVEELRTKLTEAEALVEFSQRPYIHASPAQIARLSGRRYVSNSINSFSKIDSIFTPNRVALTNNEFPDLDSSMLAAAEAGLSAATTYFDSEVQFDANTTKSGYSHRQRKRRRKKRQMINAQSEEREPLKSKINNVDIHSDVEHCKSVDFQKKRLQAFLSNDSDGAVVDNDDDEDRENKMSETLVGVSVENDSNNMGDKTLLDNASLSSNDSKYKQCNKMNNISEFSDSCSDTDVEDTNDENDILTNVDAETGDKPTYGLKEVRLHQSLAHVSSEIDSKQKLIAELQSKAAELDHLKVHYERQMTSLQWRIKETESERDSVMANLNQIEHTGEERLKRTREEFEKKLSALQLRRYKIDLTKRLREETQRTRQLEALSAKRFMELKKAKSQADNQIKSLEAAHSAKDRALQQKQAELDLLKRKNIEQKRQLSSSFTNRMAQSVIGISGASWGSLHKRTSLTGSSFNRSRLFGAAKAKWVQVSQELDADVERRQKSARLEHDLQTWIRERECLGRRLKRLQVRRACIEENVTVDSEQVENPTKLAEFDEQIRNVTAQLESVQDAIQECQASIIEFDKCGSNSSKTIENKPKKSVYARQDVSSCNSSQSNNVHALFSSCTLTEARFLLSKLFETAVSRGLLASRLQQNENQLRANILVREQEREQELEMLKLAMQHAGISSDSVEVIFSGNERSNRKTNLCPHHGTSNITGCECCTYAISSAPLSSEDSSDGIQNDDHQWQTDSVNFPNTSHQMSQSIVNLNSGGFNYGIAKARRRMLQAEDVFSVSSNSFATTICDSMPPPSSTINRRPRTAHSSCALSNHTSYLRPSCPLSASQSPTTRRRVTTSANLNSGSSNTQIGSARPNIGSAFHVSNTMSTSLILPSTNNSDSVSIETTDPISPSSNKMASVVSASLSSSTTADNVFNRLTSGMSNSPNPSRGSIHPLAKMNLPVLTSSGTNPNPVLGPPASNQPYHLMSSSAGQCSTNLSISVNNSSTQSSNQPLAAFFTSCTTQLIHTSNGTSCPSIVHQSVGFVAPIECTHIAKGHSNAVLDIDILHGSMITGSKDRTAKIWDLNTLEEVDTLHDHPNNVTKVRMCPASNLIFTVCSYFVKVWDRRDSRKCIRTLLSSGLSQEGSLETKVMRRQNICPPGETNIMDITLGGFNPSLSHLMFSATANSVKLWDLRRFYCVGKLHGSHQAPVMVLAAAQTPCNSPVAGSEPKLTVVTGSKDHYIKVFDVSPNASGLLTPTLDLEPPHYDGIESLVIHGNILFSGSRDAAIKKWNLSKNGRQEVLLAQAHKDWIQGLAVTYDGGSLVSGCRGGTLKLWKVEDCTCLGEINNAHEGAINCVRTYEDRVFTAGNDKDIRFWKFTS
ncbi:Kinesin-like protein KIF21A [Schistosoma japonicum]|nr:Kinesin-like protein KIF21A [Schistosoma japonicum]